MRFCLFLVALFYCIPVSAQTLFRERHPILGGMVRVIEDVELAENFEKAFLIYLGSQVISSSSPKVSSHIMEHEIRLHPDYTENFLENHPDDIQKFTQKIQPLPWGDDYLQSIGVGDEFFQQQMNLENTQEWKQAKARVETDVIAVVDARYNNREPPDC